MATILNFIIGLLCFAFALQEAWPAENAIKKVMEYRLIGSYPHDPEAFTQGLYFERGYFYEGTGLYGRSSLRVVEARSGEVKKRVALPEDWFGEGITVMGDKIIQLTWRSGVGIVYDKKTLHKLRSFRYAHEGWGITHDGRRLIVSDGTDTIRFWDPVGFQELDRIKVTDNGRPLVGLNELEFVEGSIFANVWPTSRIVRIDPSTGKVTGELATGDLRTKLDGKSVDVANGIAYDPGTKRVFLTGKFWPRIFVVFIRNSE